MDIRKTPEWISVGGLSKPSKMPCWSYSLPASMCITGGQLSLDPTSVCFKCYAKRNNYLWKPVQACLHRRAYSILRPHWVPNMTYLINNLSPDYFRWNDSGDLQSPEHLIKIIDVCNGTPQCRHYLPTKEYGFVQEVMNHLTLPENLCLRLSTYTVDGEPPLHLGLPCSITTTDESKVNCSAPKQGNKCLDCRKCWTKMFNLIYYKKH